MKIHPYPSKCLYKIQALSKAGSKNNGSRYKSDSTDTQQVQADEYMVIVAATLLV